MSEYPWTMIETALRNKRPVPREPREGYLGLPEILFALRKAIGLTQEGLAAYLGVSTKTILRAEAAGLQISLQVDTLEGVKDLAFKCCMKEAERVLGVMLKTQRSLPQRGPKKRTGPWWGKQQGGI